ncbi:MAG: glycoside hydrolase family 3 C-terminal domain-containing protein [Eubacteriales bacterium]|nr:glycoside hydrolase family 3 C-terminal domain-containing protein [Eubacteriales bacterium]
MEAQTRVPRIRDQKEIENIVLQMTLEEKAGMCSGQDFWHTKGVERLGIPSVMLSDGPHGIRKQETGGDHLGTGASIPAVCFPAGCLIASSFDRELAETLGETIGNECQAEKIGVVLGPSMNIKRSPLCGRNFEYYSEDPLVSSEMAAAYIKGVQSKNVGTSPKHFLANNQEHLRMTGNSIIEERTLREIYLASFEKAIKESKPWTVMASYNRVNDIFATENKEYLTGVLRKEWGFQGFTVSDWGAVNDRVEALKAGMELEMPSSGGVNDQKIIDAVKNGELEENILNQACTRILANIYKYWDNKDENAVFDREEDHRIAQRVAEESMILLKNNGMLPLSPNKKIAFIGCYASNPRYQGGGSSHINSSKVTSALQAGMGNSNISYAQGFTDGDEKVDISKWEEALETAQKAEAAVIFAGLPERFESEGYDRLHMKLPKCQNDLIEAICAVQKNVAVVLHNGSPVEMPWINSVSAVLESYLGGQAVGEAQYKILFGMINPSGKLAETFPIRLEDNPTWPYYGKDGNMTLYREGILTGYRYYDAKNIEVLFPFGHGLSYTEFAYSNLKLSSDKLKDTDCLQVSVDVKNIGKRLGKEVVQIYVSAMEPDIIRPVKELRAFEKITLNPGEKKTVRIVLNKRAFAYWNTEIHAWYVPEGKYRIFIGKSSRDIVLWSDIIVESTTECPQVFTRNSTLGEILKSSSGKKAIEEELQNLEKLFASEESSDADDKNVILSMPLRSLISYI